MSGRDAIREKKAQDSPDRLPGHQSKKSDNSGESSSTVDRLQRHLGNQAVQHLAREGTIQPSLRVGRPNSPAEREADRVAGEVGGTGPSGRTESGGTAGAAPDADTTVDRSADSGGQSTGTSDLEGRIERQKGSGQSLPDSERSFFEGRFSRDFSDVTVHDDAESDQLARSLDANAFTTGSDVFFREGQYQPGTTGGRSLLAHELTHVAQQGAAPPGGADVQRAAAGSPAKSGGSAKSSAGTGTKSPGGTGTKTGGTKTANATAGGGSAGRLGDVIMQEPFDAKAVMEIFNGASEEAIEAVGKSADLFLRLYRNLGSSNFDAVCGKLFDQRVYAPVIKDVFKSEIASGDLEDMAYMAYKSAADNSHAGDIYIRDIFRSNWGWIATLKSDLTQAEYYKMLDRIYEANPKMSVKSVIFERRFGAKLGRGEGDNWTKQENAIRGGIIGYRIKPERLLNYMFDVKGIKEKLQDRGYIDQDLSLDEESLDSVYRQFKSIPVRHLKQIDINYIVGFTDHGSDTGGFEFDRSIAINEAKIGPNSKTLVHEFGHALDGKYGFSEDSAFRSIHGWESISSASKVVNRLKEDMNPPHSSDLSEQERKIVDKVAEKAASDSREGVKRKEQIKKIKKDIKQIFEDEMSWGEWLGSSDEEISEKKSNLINKVFQNGSIDPLLHNVLHGWFVVDDRPYPVTDKGLTKYQKLSNKYYVRGSGTPWLAFPQSGAESFVTWYARSEPGEEFAELYAHWQLADEPKSEVPSVYHDWYENNVAPVGSDGSSGSTETTGSSAGSKKAAPASVIKLLRTLGINLNPESETGTSG